jgi:hypothetical protein
MALGCPLDTEKAAIEKAIQLFTISSELRFKITVQRTGGGTSYRAT